MVDVRWTLIGAQAASECHDPVDYNVIGGSSLNFAELLALWYLTSDLRGIPFDLHSDNMFTVRHNRLILPLERSSLCGKNAQLCQALSQQLR